MEIIGSGLEGQEYVTVLSWVIQTYPGKELMADLSLGIPQSKVKPLLDAETVIRLQASILPPNSVHITEDLYPLNWKFSRGLNV